MMKLLIFMLMLSIVTIQPVFAETTQLKQWIAPQECVIDGDILTPEECDQLLHPTPPTTNPPTESPVTDTRPKLAASYLQIFSLLIPFTPSSPSSVNGTSIRIVDRSESRSPAAEHTVINLGVLSFILVGAGLVVFTGLRTTTNLSKEDKFDKMYRRVSSFWTRKAK